MPDPFVRPDVRAFLAYLDSLPGPKMHEMDAPTARQVYHAMKDVADPPVGGQLQVAGEALQRLEGRERRRLHGGRVVDRVAGGVEVVEPLLEGGGAVRAGQRGVAQLVAQRDQRLEEVRPGLLEDGAADGARVGGLVRPGERARGLGRPVR